MKVVTTTLIKQRFDILCFQYLYSILLYPVHNYAFVQRFVYLHERNTTILCISKNHFSLIILEQIIVASVSIYHVLGCHFARCSSCCTSLVGV